MDSIAAQERDPLHLLFSLGADRYALAASAVREVLPLQRLKQVPEAPPWVAGLLTHRGEVIPVLDLCQRVLGRAARQSINTRLVLLQYSPAHTLGLVLEQANQVQRLPVQAQRSMGLAAGGAYLGAVQTQGAAGTGTIQHIAIDGLLPPDVASLLFPSAGTAP
ncbi:chemotaxis-related protein WspB [Acidovorax soli]|uniref:Chemotaxis-related protein WspB n=1 Tax=Acidovorax soli TaxID=592050 RepID=A0A7X0UBL3_9BURK|nr:chemotaxis protein CheW [Acidovorax soli]MBB6562228.1 chemotaxis-related protein WspB [Acidovorax soli]